MKYKVGDRVQIKSIDWYNKNKDKDGNIPLIDYTNSNYNFTERMRGLCGKVMTISSANSHYYDMVEDNGEYFWTDEMIEGLVEETVHNKCTGSKVELSIKKGTKVKHKTKGMIETIVGLCKVKTNGVWVEGVIYEGNDVHTGEPMTFVRTVEDFNANFEII